MVKLLFEIISKLKIDYFQSDCNLLKLLNKLSLNYRTLRHIVTEVSNWELKLQLKIFETDK